MDDRFARLRDPFHASELEWRIGRAGKSGEKIWATAFTYVTNRAIMQRLDEVFGPENWRNEFSVPPNAAPGTAALCTLYIKLGGEWVGKSDGADNSDMEAVKGGLSDSMKRAAVQWGIGRYLYDLEENFVETSKDKQKDWRYQPANSKKDLPAFYWQPPKLPSWALPAGEAKPDTKAKEIAEAHGMTTGDKIAPPSTAYKKAAEKLSVAVRNKDLNEVARIINVAETAKADGKLTENEFNSIYGECTLALKKIKASESEPVAA